MRYKMIYSRVWARVRTRLVDLTCQGVQTRLKSQVLVWRRVWERVRVRVRGQPVQDQMFEGIHR